MTNYLIKIFFLLNRVGALTNVRPTLVIRETLKEKQKKRNDPPTPHCSMVDIFHVKHSEFYT